MKIEKNRPNQMLIQLKQQIGCKPNNKQQLINLLCKVSMIDTTKEAVAAVAWTVGVDRFS
jgi:hypothetical protein